MSTDRELLELAAKAAGIQLDSCGENGGWYWPDGKDGAAMPIPWNPLGVDGDALRLAAHLHMMINIRPLETIAYYSKGLADGAITDSDTRRAIVRAAAEIGRAMP